MSTARELDPIASTHPSRNGLRILIAEDGADSAESMAIFLRICGHDVTIASNGPDAIEAARRHPPDVVLLDIGLPGMDGYAVAKQIRDRRETRIPLLIAVTGFGQESDRRRSAAVGIDLHLLKPIALPDLEVTLRSFQSQIQPAKKR